MDYVVSFLICGIEVFLMWLYFKKLNLFKITPVNEEETAVFKTDNKQLYGSLALVAVMMVIATLFTVEHVTHYINHLKLILLFGIVAAAAVVDFKQTIIPNLLILIGLGLRGAIYIAEYVLYRDAFGAQFKSDLIGFAFGFGFLFIVSLISKNALGFGDVKLFGVIGLTAGAICTYYTLLFCLVVSAVVSAILLILKKKGRKDSIPFGPCIAVGYFMAILLSCY